MRRITTVVFIATLVAGCASTESKPAASSSATPIPAASAPAPAPQCYSGDTSKFYPVGEKAKVAGVEVVCAASTDGKSAVWKSAKAAK